MIDALIKHLQKSAKLNDSIDVERFDATLSQIASLHDPKAIGMLLPFLNDTSKFPEAMFSIIHTIERFDDETYVQEILKGLPLFLQRSPYWANVVHFRILNHPPAFNAYRSHLARADNLIKAAAINLRSEEH